MRWRNGMRAQKKGFQDFFAFLFFSWFSKGRAETKRSNKSLRRKLLGERFPGDRLWPMSRWLCLDRQSKHQRVESGKGTERVELDDWTGDTLNQGSGSGQKRGRRWTSGQKSREFFSFEVIWMILPVKIGKFGWWKKGWKWKLRLLSGCLEKSFQEQKLVRCKQNFQLELVETSVHNFTSSSLPFGLKTTSSQSSSPQKSLVIHFTISRTKWPITLQFETCWAALRASNLNLNYSVDIHWCGARWRQENHKQKENQAKPQTWKAKSTSKRQNHPEKMLMRTCRRAGEKEKVFSTRVCQKKNRETLPIDFPAGVTHFSSLPSPTESTSTLNIQKRTN